MKVLVTDKTKEKRAELNAKELGVELVYDSEDVDDFALSYGQDGVVLIQRDGRKLITICADFVSGSVAHRRRFGGGKGQSIAKAVGVSRHFVPHVLDATAGLGKDAFVLATLGAKMTLLERSPIVHRLLASGLQQAALIAMDNDDESLKGIIERMELINIDSSEYMMEPTTSADVVFLDPMFPERQKSALVKKEMRAFHSIVGTDDDADVLLSQALNVARYRVVVKRPRIAPFLADKKPSYQLEGKSSRFDIYTIKALPTGDKA